MYGLNGEISVNTATGYIIAMSYGSLPWLAYHAFRIGKGRAHGWWLGFWMAFTVMNGLQYLSLYAVAFAAAIWVARSASSRPAIALALIRNTILAVGVFLLIAGWRLATVYPVLREDRREAMTLWDESPAAVIRYLLVRPEPDWPDTITGQHWAAYVSLTTYLGPIVVALALLSVLRGWRWWHTLVGVSGWLAIGSSQWYHASYWLYDWPFIGSAHVVTRWRFLTMLGLGMAAGSELARWRASRKRNRAGSP